MPLTLSLKQRPSLNSSQLAQGNAINGHLWLIDEIKYLTERMWLQVAALKMPFFQIAKRDEIDKITSTASSALSACILYL